MKIVGLLRQNNEIVYRIRGKQTVIGPKPTGLTGLFFNNSENIRLSFDNTRFNIGYYLRVILPGLNEIIK